MKLKAVLYFSLALVLVAGTIQGAENYTIDKVHSSINFSVRHLLISSVKGRFGDFSGSIALDKDTIENSSTKVTIKTASVDTDNEGRDEHLRNADFFNIEKFPEMSFSSSKVVKRGSFYIMTGNFTLNGITKEIEIPFELMGPVTGPSGKSHIGAEAELIINRKDYGMTWNKTFDTGGVAVGDEVKIELLIEAVGD